MKEKDEEKERDEGLEDVRPEGEINNEERGAERDKEKERDEETDGEPAPVYVLEPDYDKVVKGAIGQLGTEGVDPSFESELHRVLKGVYNEAGEGIISEETAMVIARGMDYERAVAQARLEGEVTGRNSRIEERLLSEAETDGVPHPGCGQGTSRRGKTTSIFDLAREAN